MVDKGTFWTELQNIVIFNLCVHIADVWQEQFWNLTDVHTLTIAIFYPYIW